MAKDIFHGIVREALENEGWHISHDPFEFQIFEANFKIDLGLHEILGAEKEGRKIAVEIKSFIGKSLTYDFHLAMGQFVEYRFGLHLYEPERVLYLAMPSLFYRGFFQKPFYQLLSKHEKIKIAVFDPNLKIIEQWIE